MLRSLKTPSEMKEEDSRTEASETDDADGKEKLKVDGEMLRRRTWMEETPDHTASAASTTEVNIGRIYTAWGKWSKCRRRTCKQVRKR